MNDVRATAEQVGAEITELTEAWDKAEEVDTNLGADVERIGRNLVDLLNTLAASISEADPLRSAQLNRYAIDLGEAVDNYAELYEHDFDFSIDIFDRLGPGIGLVRRVLAVLEDPAIGDRPTVGELIERLRRFPLNLEVWVAVPSSVEGYIPLDGTANEGCDDNPAHGDAASFVVLGTRET